MTLWRDVGPHYVNNLSLTKRPPVPLSALVILAFFLVGIVDAKASQAQDSTARTVVVPEYRIGEIKVTRDKALPNEMVREVLGLVSGQVFNESQLLKALETLKQGYGRIGFINFKATRILDFDEQRKVVNLTLNIDEDRAFKVNRITITGNTRTPDEAIRRWIPLREGFLFDSLRLEMARSRLNELGLVDEIKPEDIVLEPSTSEPKVDITLKVREKEPK